MKGAYNATDLNRVGEAVEYVAERLNEIGGFALTVTAKQDWTMQDIPTPEQMAAYIADIRTLRGAYAIVAPQTPTDAENLTFGEANDIETILLAADAALERVIASFVYSGQTYSGVILEAFT